MKEQRLGGRAPCPNCSAPCAFRSSRQISPTFREVRLTCSNDDCGWKGVASLIFERTIVQSAMPNPAVTLPVAPPRIPRRDRTGRPIPANDDEAGAEATAIND